MTVKQTVTIIIEYPSESSVEAALMMAGIPYSGFSDTGMIILDNPKIPRWQWETDLTAVFGDTIETLQHTDRAQYIAIIHPDTDELFGALDTILTDKGRGKLASRLLEGIWT